MFAHDVIAVILTKFIESSEQNLIEVSRKIALIRDIH